MHAPTPTDTPALDFNLDRFHLISICGDVRYATPDAPVTISAFVCYRPTKDIALVVMVDGNHGASITNAADRILPFIHRQHLGRRGFEWKKVRWIYRDSQGDWDEVKMTWWDGANKATVGFQPRGDRSLELDLNAVQEMGFGFDSHLRSHLRNAIERSLRADRFALKP